MNWMRNVYGDGSSGPGPQCDASVTTAHQQSQFSPRGANRSTAAAVGHARRFAGTATLSPGPRYLPHQACKGVPTKTFSSLATKTSFTLGQRFIEKIPAQNFGPARYLPQHPGTFGAGAGGGGAAGLRYSAKRFSSNQTIAPGPGAHRYRAPRNTGVIMAASTRFPHYTAEQKDMKRLGTLKLRLINRPSTSRV